MRNSHVEVWGRQQNERHDQLRREQPAGDSAIGRPFEVLAIHGVEFEHFRRYLASTQNLPASWALPPGVLAARTGPPSRVARRGIKLSSGTQGIRCETGAV